MLLRLLANSKIGLLVIATLFSACSNKPRNTINNSNGPLFFSEAACKGPVVEMPDDSDINNLHQNVLRLRDLFNAHSMGGILYRGNYYVNGSDLSPANPLLFSVRANHQYFLDIKFSLNLPQHTRFYEWLVKGNIPGSITIDELDFADENYLGLIVSQIEGLFEMQQRLKVNHCQKENLTSKRVEDIRAFAVLMAGECPDGLLYSSTPEGAMVSACLQQVLDEWTTLEDRYKPLAHIVSQNLFNVCAHLQLENCRQTIDRELSAGNGWAYWQQLKASYRINRYDPFFKIVHTQKDIQCKISGRETLILINIHFAKEISVDHRETLKLDLIEFVAKKWSKQGKSKIVFNFPTSRTAKGLNLTINWSSAPVSYVPDQNRNTMYLDPMLKRDDKTSARRIVMAHEFGHVLGFRDCYVEFFEADSNQFVFYQLDSRNIMCSISGATSVPDNYNTQVLGKRCIF